jgi:hypothetical protein
MKSVGKFGGGTTFAISILAIVFAIALPIFFLWLRTKKMREEQFIRDKQAAAIPVKFFNVCLKFLNNVAENKSRYPQR